MRRLMVLVPIVLLVACGGGSDGDSVASSGGSPASDSDPIAVLTAAPEATVDEESSRIAFSMTIPGEVEITMEAEGVFDFVEQRMSLEMDMGEMFRQLGAPEGLDATMEMVTEGTTVYFRMPMLSAMGAPGVDEDTWLRMDIGEAVAQQGLDLSQMTGNGMNDPRQGLAMLKGADDVREVGSEDVRGEETTHYQGTVDLEKAARNQGGIVDEEAFQRFIDTLPSTTMDVEAWIDDEGRARRLSFEMPLPQVAAPSGEAVISMDFFDFGVDADIQVPENAIDAADVVPGMGGTGGTGGMPSEQNGY